jgi:GTPase Era involved in 16S rRNA processing
MSGRKVFLQLRVKVRKDWRDDEDVLRRFGYGKKST